MASRKKKTKYRYVTRKRKTRRRKDRRIPIIPTVTIVSTALSPAPSGNTLISRVKNQDFEGLLYDLREKWAGIDAHGQIQWHWLFNTYAPIVVSGILSKVIGRFANKHIAKLPIIGRRIKF